MRDFDDLTRIRETVVDGDANWHWPVSDSGAWDGPVSDWENSHKEKYFKYLKKADVVFCAGGNCGLYTRLFARRFKLVYSFEPDPLNFHCLVKNNQLANVMKFQAALGHTHKMITMNHLDMGNVGMHTINETAPDLFIPMMKIDDFYPETIDLIQLDVEGYEANVLRGGLRNIEKFKPVISCERGNAETTAILAPLGYQVVDQSVSDTIYVAG